MQKYSGQLGIVLLPDPQTHRECIRLASEIRPNALDIGGVHHPHVTLYHARLSDVPRDEMEKLLRAVANRLPLQVSLYRIAVFAKKFAFWDAQMSKELMELHEETLSLASYFAPSAGAVGTETLQLSWQEGENIRLFGHPLVKSLWRPHITLGYNEAGYSSFKNNSARKAQFERVALASIGEYGTVKELLKTH